MDGVDSHLFAAYLAMEPCTAPYLAAFEANALGETVDKNFFQDGAALGEFQVNLHLA